jgi:hypothetical protein
LAATVSIDQKAIPQRVENRKIDVSAHASSRRSSYFLQVGAMGELRSLFSLAAEVENILKFTCSSVKKKSVQPNKKRWAKL